MNNELFLSHLSYILNWWEEFVDWENGGIFTYPGSTKKAVSWEKKVPLMHLRQLYNYSVGHEHGLGTSEKIALHLYDSLDTVFPDQKDDLFISSSRRNENVRRLDGYLNAYVAIGLSRFARAFKHRPALERALKVYHQLDKTFTDTDLRSRGTWNIIDLDSPKPYGKSDNAHIHRCEAALNILHALQVVAPDLLKQEKPYLENQLEDLITFFDTHISVPHEGFTIETMEDDARPFTHYRTQHQSLAHGFEWLGFCLEIERHSEINIPFMQNRMKDLCTRTLENGLAPNGCFRNNYVPDCFAAPQQAEFWPQVEAILGALWSRKQWGEAYFPLEKSERMLTFYLKYFLKSEKFGGGILSGVSENGVPTNYHTGHGYKCDHHAVRMVEKVLEYDLLGEPHP